MEAPKIHPEHEWLAQFVGEWVSGADASGKPSDCPSKEVGRMIGGIWLLLEGAGEMPGFPEFRYQMTLGFDAAKGRFVGTWVGSMSGNFWIYDGELDAERGVLTLESEGPAMNDPSRRAKYRDVVTLHSAGHRSLRGMMQNSEGAWEAFMESHHFRA